MTVEQVSDVQTGGYFLEPSSVGSFSLELQRIQDVVPSIFGGHEIVGLENESRCRSTYASQFTVIHPGDVRTTEPYRSFVDVVQPGSAVQQGRFSRAGGSGHRHEFTRSDLCRDTVQGPYNLVPGPNTASLGCLAWSWLEAMDDDGVQESGRCWFGVFSGLETVVGPTAFAGRAPARSGPHPGPGELSDRARPHPCQVLRGKKPRRSTTPSGERNWWRP